MKGLLVLVFTACLLTPMLLALDVRPVKRITLQNGVTIIAKVDRRKELVGVHTFIKSGWSHDEKSQRGLSNLLWSTLAARQYLPRSPFTVTAGCEEEVSFLCTEALPEHISHVVSAHEKLLKTKKLSNQAFQENKRMALKRVKRGRLKPIVDGYSHSALTALFNGATDGTAFSRYGNEETIGNITLGRLSKELEGLLFGQNIVLSLVGNFELPEAIKLVKRVFGSLPKKGLARKRRLKKSVGQRKERRLGVEGLKNTYVTLGFRAPTLSDKDFYAMSLIETWLLSGQSGQLRELFGKGGPIEDLGLTYTRSNKGAKLFIDLIARVPKVDWAVSQLLAKIKSLAGKPLTNKELHSLKIRAKNAQALERQRVVMNSYLLGRYEALASYELYEYYNKRIDELTAKDLSAVAARYLNEDSYRLLVLQPAGLIRSEYSGIARKVFPNGLTVIVKPTYGEEVIGLTVGLPLGTFNAPKGKEGLSEALFHLLGQGEGVKKLQEAGAIVQCPAATDCSAIVALTTKYCFAQAFADIYELFSEPMIDELGVKRALAAIKRRRRSDLFSHYQRTKDELAISVADLKRFHEQNFTAGQTTIVVCGDVTPERVFRLASFTFGSLDSGNVRALPFQEQYVETKSWAGNRFLLTFPIEKPFRDYAALQVLTHLLAGGKESHLAKLLKKERIPAHSINSCVRFIGNKANVYMGATIEGRKAKRLKRVLSDFVASIPRLSLSGQRMKEASSQLALTMAAQHENKLQESFSIFWCNLYAPSPLFFHRLPVFYRQVKDSHLAKLANDCFKDYRLLYMGH